MSRRSAFTLVELLVVIAIIGVLVAMLLPAVQMAREAGRRSICTQNLHQVALAINQHESAYGCYPPGLPNCTNPMDPHNWGAAGGTANGAWCQGPTWTVAIMPYIEEQSQFDLMKMCMPNSYNFCQDCTQGVAAPTVLVCPSAETQDMSGYFTGVGPSSITGANSNGVLKGNYVGNFGSNNYLSYGSMTTAGIFDLVDIRGARGGQVNQVKNDPSMLGNWKMASKYGVKGAMVQDGTSRTILASEILSYDGPLDPRGAWTFGGMGGAAFTTSQPPNTQNGDTLSSCQPVPMPPPPFQFNCTVDPNLTTMPGATFAAARSAHSGGVNVVMVDGSTHFVADAIDAMIWKNLGTRNGNIPADLPPE